MPNFTRRILLIVLLSASPCVGWSQPIDATVFSLSTLDATARGAGLAGAVTASPSDDAAAFFYNPALLESRASGKASIGMLNHLSSLKTGTVGYVRSVGDLGTAAGGIRFLGWGSIPRTDAAGVQDGTFGAGELAVTAAAARDLKPEIRVGAALHWLHSAIDGQAASALAVDVGVLLHRDDSGFAVGISLHQVGVVLSSVGSTKDTLPTDLRIGISKRLNHLPLLLTATAYGFARNGPSTSAGSALATVFRHLLIGAEFQFSDAFQLRLGYDYRRHEALKIKPQLDFAGLGFGAGFRVRGIAIDYARTSWSSLGGVHRFGVSTRL